MELFKGNSTLDSLSLSKLSFDIYQDEALHDTVINLLQKSSLVTLKALNRPTPADACTELDEQTSIRFLSDSVTLHRQLSRLPPETLAIVGPYKPDETDCYLQILKVGKVTGDLCIKLVGQPMDILEYIGCFSTWNSGYHSLSLLISSHNIFKPSSLFESLEMTLIESPYFLVPGSILRLQSPDMGTLASAIIRILNNQEEAPDCCDIVNHNHPMTLALSPPEAVNLNGEDDEDLKDSFKLKSTLIEETGYKMVQLTRPEVTFLIGKNGRKIEEIRKKSQATVKVVPLNTEMNLELKLRSRNVIQFIRISGTKKQIRDALHIIESDIYQFRNGGITTY